MLVSYIINIRCLSTGSYMIRVHTAVMRSQHRGTADRREDFPSRGSKDIFAFNIGSVPEYSRSALLCASKKWTGLRGNGGIGSRGKVPRGEKLTAAMTPGGRTNPISEERAAIARGEAAFCRLLLSTCQGRIPRLVENATSRRLWHTVRKIERVRVMRTTCTGDGCVLVEKRDKV